MPMSEGGLGARGDGAQRAKHTWHSGVLHLPEEFCPAAPFSGRTVLAPVQGSRYSPLAGGWQQRLHGRHPQTALRRGAGVVSAAGVSFARQAEAEATCSGSGVSYTPPSMQRTWSPIAIRPAPSACGVQHAAGQGSVSWWSQETHHSTWYRMAAGRGATAAASWNQTAAATRTEPPVRSFEMQIGV